MRTLLIIMLAAIAAIAGTTNVRIYHQSVASPASVQNKQIGVNTSADANLGYKMWFGKDADGNVTQFLAKDKNARMLSVRQDSSFALVDTAWKVKADTGFITGIKATRLYFGTEVGTSSRNDSTFSIRDTAKIMKADSGNFSGITVCHDVKIPDSGKGVILKAKNGTTLKYWKIFIDSTGALSADSTGLN